MGDQTNDIQNRGSARHAGDIDASADDLAEIDSLVSSLVEEINDASDEISRVMASDDEGAATGATMNSPKTLSNDGAPGAPVAPGAPEASDHADAIAEAAEDLDDGAPVDAASIDDALEKVAAELEADFETAGAPAPPGEHATEHTDDATSATGTGEDSIAAQIDEELARAVGEEGEAPTPEPASEVEEEEFLAEPESAPADEADDDESPADAAATEEAVHAVAEAIDRLLDEEVGDDAQDAPAEPSDEVTDDEPIEDDEAEPEAAAPEKAPPPPAPPAPPAPPTPAKKPTPEAVKPGPVARPASEPQPARSLSPMGVLVGALVLVNKPFASVPAGLRDTLGLAGLVTLFNAMCLWVFLLLR